jgi:hypothetical protein
MIWIAVSLSLTLALAVIVHRSFGAIDGVRRRTAVGLFLAGAALALPTRLLVAYTLDSIGWSLRASSAISSLVAWLSATVIAAPIEHLVLAVVVWPLYRAHRLERLGTAVSAAALAAAGMGSVVAALLVYNERTISGLLLGLGTLVSRLFGAGIWASFLASSRSRYKQWVPAAWLCGVIVDGFVRHLLEGRGPGFRIVSVPPLFAMFVIAWVIVRRSGGSRESAVFGHVHRLGLGVDAPGLETVRAAFQHAHRPALVHWIVGGALVNFGASLCALALGVLVAHFFGIDLSRVDEFDANATAPLFVLGLHVLLSFPLAGFLMAKASAADSLFEPAVSALVSIVALTVLLSRSAPVTLVLGVALSPVAFGLACMGAWFGIERRSSP